LNSQEFDFLWQRKKSPVQVQFFVIRTDFELKDYATKYLEATNTLLDLINSLKETQLDLSGSEGWTPRQVIHHLADSEAQSYARLRRLIAEPGSIIQGYDEAMWAENPTLNYKNQSIESAIAVIKSVRQSSYELLLRMDETLLSNKGMHTERGEYSILKWLETYIKHPIEHSNQIRKIL
jgi:hypothetical protein